MGKPANWTTAFPEQTQAARTARNAKASGFTKGAGSAIGSASSASSSGTKRANPAWRKGRSASGWVKRKSPVRRRSKAMDKKMRIYRERRLVFLLANPLCVACKNGTAINIHHKFGRGELLMDEQYWLQVCLECHVKIHNRPEWARKAGYLAKSGEWKSPGSGKENA